MNEKVRNILAPDVETQLKRNETIKRYSAYFIIALITLLVLFVGPIIAGGITGEGWDYYLPKSFMGWIVFWAIRAGTVVGNIALYILFKAQAKINSLHHPNYIEANTLLEKDGKSKEFIPQSPKQKMAKDYSIKMVFMVIFTLGESIIIGSIAISFDLVTFFSCVTSSVSALLFGWWAMIKDEMYWQDEYLRYAKYATKEQANEPENAEEPQGDQNA